MSISDIAFDETSKSIQKINGRMCVPAFVRLTQLYAFGHTNAQIAEILASEFEDIDMNALSAASVKVVIDDNRPELEKARLHLANECQDELRRQVAYLFNTVQQKENKLVDVYVGKLDAVLDELRDIDFSEQDDMGNYVNTSRIFVLLEMSQKIQAQISKLVGTDALREIEAYRQKMEIKSHADNKKGLLIPAASGRVVDEANGSPSQFI